MKRLTLFIQATALTASLVAVSMTAMAANRPGECGEYMYWHDGHCADARAKPSTTPWQKSVF
jgi:hypothetical protein